MVAPSDPDPRETPAPFGFTAEAATDVGAPPLTAHLLKVAGAVTRDANQTWAELWAEFKPHVTASGTVLPEMEQGFVPACGWREFLERFWLLKHYLDSVERVCRQQHGA